MPEKGEKKVIFQVYMRVRRTDKVFNGSYFDTTNASRVWCMKNGDSLGAVFAEMGPMTSRIASKALVELNNETP